MQLVARGLALAFFAGPWTLSGLQERASKAIGARPKWLIALCTRVHSNFAERPNELAPLAEFVANDERLRDILTRQLRGKPLRIRRWYLAGNSMVAVDGPPADFGVPAVATEGDLATYLGIAIELLPWYADVKRINAARSDTRLRHYRYRWIHKPSGGMRLLESPKPRLKAIQRTILRGILTRCPPDTAAHGFVAAHSVRSYASMHVGKQVVLRMDLEDFFLSIRAARVSAIFRRLGYPQPVARVLTGLCCAPTPEDVISVARPTLDFQGAMRMRTSHLAQGAPTSPALSNLACLRLDRRLRGLAQAAGATYSRYADDLAFSGDRTFQRQINRFIVRVSAIAIEEGFRVRHRKTRVMRTGGRQWLAGVVVNKKLNIARDEYDRLRALLYNAARYGPNSQNHDNTVNFRDHLLGRIAWVALSNSSRGRKLQRAFARIDWSQSSM